jgi:hypothetical protein
MGQWQSNNNFDVSNMMHDVECGPSTSLQAIANLFMPEEEQEEEKDGYDNQHSISLLLF